MGIWLLLVSIDHYTGGLALVLKELLSIENSSLIGFMLSTRPVASGIGNACGAALQHRLRKTPQP